MLIMLIKFGCNFLYLDLYVRSCIMLRIVKEVFIFDDVFLVLGYFIVLLYMVNILICLMCGINFNLLLVLVFMDIVIEVCLVIVLV